MPKIDDYVQLAAQTAREISADGETWRSFLQTASTLYKYGFYDQMMIYAQRPDATACASFELWTNTMRRYVRRGAKGIALLDMTGDVPHYHYVFDAAFLSVPISFFFLGKPLFASYPQFINRFHRVFNMDVHNLSTFSPNKKTACFQTAFQ